MTVKKQTAQKYEYAEAFCLMQYEDEETGEVETIWNSRDGVTPLTVKSRAGNIAKHVHWQFDLRDPNHVPKIGDRVFAAFTPKSARERAENYVEENWHNEIAGCRMQDIYSSKKAAVADWVDSYLTHGVPNIVIVDEAFLKQLEEERRQK
jgi:hypothetical protein